MFVSNNTAIFDSSVTLSRDLWNNKSVIFSKIKYYGTNVFNDGALKMKCNSSVILYIFLIQCLFTYQKVKAWHYRRLHKCLTYKVLLTLDHGLAITRRRPLCFYSVTQQVSSTVLVLQCPCYRDPTDRGRAADQIQISFLQTTICNWTSANNRQCRKVDP